MLWPKFEISRYIVIPVVISLLVAVISIVLVGYANGWAFANWSLPTSSSQETVTTGDIISVVISTSGITIPVIIGYVSLVDEEAHILIYKNLTEAMKICDFKGSDITPASVHYQSVVASSDDDAVVKAISAADYFSGIVKMRAKEKENFTIDAIMLKCIVADSRCDAFRRLFERRLDRCALIEIAYILVAVSVFLFFDLLYRYHVPTNPNLSVWDYGIVVFAGALNIVCYALILMSLSWRKAYQKEINDRIFDVCSISKGAIVVWAQYKESVANRGISESPAPAAKR